jgi:hypothetical protein
MVKRKSCAFQCVQILKEQIHHKLKIFFDIGYQMKLIHIQHDTSCCQGSLSGIIYAGKIAENAAAFLLTLNAS